MKFRCTNFSGHLISCFQNL